MFIIINDKTEPEITCEVRNMLNSDAKSPFDVFSEPLSSLLGLMNYRCEDRELGVLLNSESIVCGYSIFSLNEIHQFYISPNFRKQKLGREMLNEMKLIFKLRGEIVINIHPLDTSEAKCFWKSVGAHCENLSSRLWCIPL
ncbi:TPA: GNAT family N-acetyltransferase [Yersinia enterocolitica]|nr:GNAT family N-acetyltransferase [Yersinia enterocolitica]